MHFSSIHGYLLLRIIPHEEAVCEKYSTQYKQFIIELNGDDYRIVEKISLVDSSYFIYYLNKHFVRLFAVRSTLKCIFEFLIIFYAICFPLNFTSPFTVVFERLLLRR